MKALISNYICFFGMMIRNLKLSALFLACLAAPGLLMSQEAPIQPADTVSVPPHFEADDFNKEIYYPHKLEYSQELGVLPINIPFAFDIFVGGDYTTKPLHYLLIPTFSSLRWQMGALRGPGPLRGNTDFVVGVSLTGVESGPEDLYGAFNLGLRRNFVQRNWRTAPYFETRVGAGIIDAKGKNNVVDSQGQDITFTLMLGSGVRYNFNSRYSMAVGVSYMHISNLFLSQPRFPNNGINVCGPMLGFNMRLGNAKAESRP